MSAALSNLALSDLYRHARRRLSDAGVETPDLDARLLLEHFTGTTRVDMIANPGMEVAADRSEALEAALSRRIAGEPVHRILGYRDFYGMRLSLSADTLEPRPDTETLIETVLPFLREWQRASVAPRILDLGTGSGAIALALLAELPSATALGVDISTDALATAGRNAQALGCGDRFETRRSDWFSDVSEKFHAIVANPPYIESEVVRQLSREVREHDPARALDGGPDGLEAYRVIATHSTKHLERDGVVAVEIGFDQAEAVKHLFFEAGFALRTAGFDLLGHCRALVLARA